MRVMERAVQAFGVKLGVPKAAEKNWQNILDELNKKVRMLPESTPEEKEAKAEYANASANLFNVKLAWRNPVMHPRASYNPEEAVEIYDKVKTFTKHLTTIL